jgi:hypothetical protein
LKVFEKNRVFYRQNSKKQGKFPKIVKHVKLLIQRIIPFYIFGTLITPFAYSGESESRLENPFHLPQTNFYLGNANYTIQLPDRGVVSKLQDSSINIYGVDLEVNYSRFMNIGAYLRFESINTITGPGVNSLFAALIGGFSRFHYIPPFLDKKTFKTSLFLRTELGGGPLVMGIPSGLAIQPGIHLGIESYINKWIGLSFSYGQVFEYGKETLSGNSTIWNQGQVFLGAVKTTAF